MDYKQLLGDDYKDDMTAEDILKALEKIQIQDSSDELEKYKNLVSKANSEASNFKKQLQAKQTEEEKKEAERLAEFERLSEELNALKRDKSLSDNTAQFLALGYDEKLAQSTAEALVDGNLAKVFENQKLFTTNLEKKIKQDIMKSTSKPDQAGAEGVHMTRDKFLTLSLEERIKFSQEHPEDYKELYKGEQ